MKDPIVWQLLLQLALILLNAVFACAEIAVISFNDAKLARLAAAGDKRAVTLARLTSQPARFLATIQVAITLSGFLGSAFAADNFAEKLATAAMSWKLPIRASTLQTISVVLITLLLSYVTLVLGELVPKRIAMKKAESLALGMAKFISVISVLFKPLVTLLTASTNGVLCLMRIDPAAEEESVTEEEIRMMVDVGSEKGTIHPTEKQLIQNVFEFNDITAGEIATHRTEVTFLEADEPETWAPQITATRFSLYPICHGSVDDVVGVLNTKDYFRLENRAPQAVWSSAVSTPIYVPESMRADKVFAQMQTTHNHFAVVVDEYGGTCGILTMHDLLEQLAGAPIEDEKECVQRGEPLTRLDARTWRVNGPVTLLELNDALGLHLHSSDYETLGGLVLEAYGGIPADGAQFTVALPGLQVQVEAFEEHAVQRALLTLPDPEAAKQQAAADADDLADAD